MGNTQSIGSGIGDIFWSDNPNRRSRAFQLEGDCRRAIDEFNNLKQKYDKDSERVKGVMSNYLQKHGFSSVAHLDDTVQKILTGQELQKWQDLKKALSANNFISDIVMAISGVAIVGGAATIGVLVLVGIMSGPVGWAALGTIATIAGIVGAVVLVWGIIEGGIERSKLRDTINDLFQQRQKIYVQLRTLQAYSLWIAKFELFFLDEDLSKHPERFEKQYESEFQQQSDKAKPAAVAQELRQFDQQRNAWTNEDPSPDVVALMAIQVSPETHIVEKPKRSFILTDDQGHKHSFDAQIVGQDPSNSREQCVIEDIDTQETWIMKAEAPADESNQHTIALQDVLFTLVRPSTGSVYLEHCRMSLAPM